MWDSHQLVEFVFLFNNSPERVELLHSREGQTSGSTPTEAIEKTFAEKTKLGEEALSRAIQRNHVGMHKAVLVDYLRYSLAMQGSAS